MGKTRRLLILFFIFQVFFTGLVGCSPKPDVPTVAKDSTALVPTVMPPMVIDASEFQVVDGFLNSLIEDVTGTSSLVFLSPSLQSSVNGGLSISNLLTLQQPFNKFTILQELASQVDGFTLVPVTLTAEREFRKTFIVAQVDGSPKIQAVISYNLQTSDITSELAAADTVVLQFFSDLNAKDVDAAIRWMAAEQNTPAMRQELDLQVQAVTEFIPVSLFMVDSSPERVIYQANIYTTAGGAAPGGWLPGLNKRYIELTATAEGWRIARLTHEQLPVD